MFLKRKHSESELSFSSSSAFGSMMDMTSPTSPTIRNMSWNATPAHLHSRTMKRFRDSRPSDEEVHRKLYWDWLEASRHSHNVRLSSSFSCKSNAERTLNMLYTGQKQLQAEEQRRCVLPTDFSGSRPQLDMPTVYPPPPTTTSQSTTKQTSLHSFWNLPGSSASSSAASTPPPFVDRSIYTSSSCEDCGQALGGAADGGDLMDIDSFGVDIQSGCNACGKRVCSQCSVASLDEQKRCLTCAGQLVTAGGNPGWGEISVPVY